MKKLVRFIIFALIAAGLAYYAYVTVTAPLPVKLATVTPKDVAVYFTEPGTVQKGVVKQVYPAISGEIINLSVKLGQRVKAGDPLFEIDPKEYVNERSRCLANIRSIEANIETVKSEEVVKKKGFLNTISELESQLLTIEAQRASSNAERLLLNTIDDQVSILELSITQSELDRDFWADRLATVESLYENGAATKLDVSDAERRVDEIENRIAQYRKQIAAAKSEAGKASAKSKQINQSADRFYDALVSAARGQIESLRKNLEQDYSSPMINYYKSLINAENERIKAIDENIGKNKVLSPVDGHVVELNAEKMTHMPPQTCAVAIMTAAGGLLIDSYVTTKDVLGVREGDAVGIILKGRDGNREFAGTVAEIQKWAEARISALGIEEKRVKLVIRADIPGGDGDGGAASGDSSGGVGVNAAGGGDGEDVVADDVNDNDIDASAIDYDDPRVLLLPGYDVEIRYTVYHESNKLTVPSGAIFKNGGVDCVFIMDNGKATARPVVTGVKTSLETVVEDGLSIGDLVVSEANTEGLTEGKRIISTSN